MTEQETVTLLFDLTSRCEDRNVLDNIADPVFRFLEASTLQDKYPRMVSLVWQIQRVNSAENGYEKALEYAKKFKLYKTLTQVAYRSNQVDLYDSIHEVIEGTDYRVEWAMRTVYELDKDSIVEAVRQ